MKKKILLLVFLITSMFLNAQPVLEWAKSVGGVNDDCSQSTVVDASGNVYTTGYFSGTADFDPGPGVANLVSVGGSTMTDAFVLKLDALGNFVWAKRIGGTNYDSGWGIAVDVLGNVIVGGHFTGGADFDPGTTVFSMTSTGSEDGFVVKLDPSGNFLWAKKYGTAGTNHTWSVATDVSNNIYIAGWYDAFIIKFDPVGNTLWTKTINGTGGGACPLAMQVDPLANVFITGMFTGTIDANVGSGVYNLTAVGGGSNAFILKLDSFGDFIWAKSFGNGAGTVTPQSIALDPSGNIYTTGLLMGTGDFDPGPGIDSLYPTGLSDDVFICKLDPSGNYLWAKNLAGNLADIGRCITTDASGNVYTAGFFQGTMAFNPGSSLDSITTLGQHVYLMKLSPLGNFMWVRILGGMDVFALQVDSYSNIYASGYYYVDDFDPGPGTYDLTSVGGREAYIVKLNQNFNGVAESINASSISIYPNPTNGLFMIQILSGSQNHSIQIFNNLGALVYEQKNSDQQITIDLSNQSSGIYFVKVISGNEIVGTQKIMKE